MTKKHISFFTFLLFSICNLQAQSFAIANRTISFTDASRSNRAIPIEIYYPGATATVNAAMANGTQTFPVIVFGHGFVMTWDVYQNIWEALVPQGYIVVFPKTEGSISPSHTEFAKDIAFLISKINVEGQNNSSFLYNRVDSMNCVMGHSMGGGAAFLSVNYNSQIKSVATLAAAETNPSAISVAESVLLPALVFAGANDCISPPAANQLLIYNALTSACKTYISVTGGSHCQFANSTFTCTFGESTCSPAPTIARAEQQSIVNTFLVPWLNFQLKNNCPQGNLFDDTLISSLAITYQKNCSLCNSIGIKKTNMNETEFKFFPNPTNSVLNFTDLDSKNLSITSVYGQVYYTSNNKTENTLIDVSLYPSGVYFIRSDRSIKRFIKY